MIKHLLFLLLVVVVFFPYDLWAACTGSSPTWTCTPDYTSVNSCVSQASAGDTINVSAGDASWTTPITVTKSMKIIGAGSSSINITATDYSFIFAPDATSRTGSASSDTYTFELSGFRFSGTNALHFNGSTINNPFRRVKIHDNRFSNSGYYLRMTGDYWGVMYANTFDANSTQTPFMLMGCQDDDNTSVTNESYYGTADNFYIEENTFSGSGYFGIQSGQGGRWALRYNTISSTSIGSPMLDMHGAYQTWGAGLVMAEVYGNIFGPVTTYIGGTWMKQRGGKLLFFNNRGTGSVTPDFTYLDEGGTSDTPLIQHPHLTAIFNNWWNDSNQNGYPSNDPSSDPYSRIGASDVLFYDSSFDGSIHATRKGVGCGSATPTMNCTTGVWYWKTSAASCSTPPTTIADMKTTIQAGILYRCTAPNTWTAYYTPYIYPHPLRGESGGDTFELSVAVVGGGTVNSSQGGVQCTRDNTPCTKTVDDGTVIIFTLVPYPGHNEGVITGTGCGTTTTMSEARSCTVTFSPIYLLN